MRNSKSSIAQRKSEDENKPLFHGSHIFVADLWARLST
jgi:hypothetical protein